MNIATLQLIDYINDLISIMVSFVEQWGLVIFWILLIIFALRVVYIFMDGAANVIKKG